MKLGDFGVATIVKNTARVAQSRTGTLQYMAPELFEDSKLSKL